MDSNEFSAVMKLSDDCNAMRKQRDELLTALQGLFEHCAMIHKYGGDGCNQKQADAAITAARAAIAKATEAA